MNLSDLIAVSALILSMVSIYIQRTDVRKQLIVSNFSEYTSRYQDLVKSFPASVVKEDFVLFDLSENEREHTLRYMLLYFDLCYEEYFLYKSGLIDSRLWKVWKAGIVAATSRPAFRQSWKYLSEKRNVHQDAEFRSMMDAMTSL